ncbi:WYL domain-containing protein [Vibrio makurazakiensis]|uniref:helix-turn-helix transcriptional regulator n=1 Tax=Vibrio makurazakiensis TaxID=2910250 RepID=UPI003D0EDB7B
MTKRATTRESLVLAFELLKRIPRSRKVTAAELHKELEHAGIARDIRTIQRNLEMLCEHFEIERDDRTKPYGYSLKQNIDGLALPTLTPQESLLLALAEDYLSNLLPQSLMGAMQSFFSEARLNLLPVKGNSKERAWLKKVRFVNDSQPLLPPNIDEETFNAVSEALFHDRFLTIEYTNAKKKQNNALVMPLGLAQQSNRIYLVCRFDGFDNERSVALHRITKATVSTFSFERPKSFSLEQYDADGRFGFGEGVKGILSFTADENVSFYLSETPLSNDQTIEARNEKRYLIKATVTDSLLLKRWLMAFGNKIGDIHFNDDELDLTISNT